jgi:hypothetical protein
MSCFDVLVSWDRHDFRQCSCENEAFVDGGFDYMRSGAADMSKISEVEVRVFDEVKKGANDEN